MDIFTRFNRKSIDDRQMDTLIGLSKGVLADGKVDQAEAEFLRSWLVQSRQASDNPVIANLLAKVGVMLQDNTLDDEESAELLSILRGIAGDPSEIGELAKAASLPINKPAPNVTFPGRCFVFTGTCAYGTRVQCHQATEALGGTIATGITKKINYLVLGTEPPRHPLRFGRVIRSIGFPCAGLSGKKASCVTESTATTWALGPSRAVPSALTAFPVTLNTET